MCNEVYILKRDLTRKTDSEFDAVHIPFKDSLKLSYMMLNTDLYGVKMFPDNLVFQANFRIIEKNDFPSNDLDIPIFSCRMVEQIFKSSSMEYHKIPVQMLDDTYLKGIFTEKGQIKDEVPKRTNFVAISLRSEFKDYLNLSLSVFRPSRDNPKIPGRIKKAVLNKPIDGFPGIFRLKYMPAKIFINRVVKEDLESIDIRGCRFEAIESI